MTAVPKARLPKGVEFQAEVNVMNADGSEKQRLARIAWNFQAPAWSPDGQKLAFERRLDPTKYGGQCGSCDIEVYVMNADGSGQQNLTRNVAQDNSAAWSPDGEKIAFVSDRDGKPEGHFPPETDIHVMNADGSGQQNLTRNPAGARNPVWSPDGRKIAFERVVGGVGRNRNIEIYVMNADGSGQRRLTSNPAFDGEPVWSPDGKSIAFASDRNQLRYHNGVYVMNADGSGQRRLTRNPAFDDRSPVWSPDGRKIAFERVVGGVGNNQNIEIYVMNADGSDQRRLTSNPTFDGSPVWSPDGQRIAFASDRNRLRYHDDVYVMNADGSGQRRLTRNLAQESWPVWSPDGQRIAFTRVRNTPQRRDRNSDVYVMNADGSGQRNLTRNPAGDGHPAWSPDGRTIGFVSNRGGNNDIYVMNADGSGLWNLTRDIDRQAFGIAWAPAQR